MKFRNKKNGMIYTYIDEVINCTNAQDGQVMILYTKDNLLFVREKEEFFQKFERIINGSKKLY